MSDSFIRMPTLSEIIGLSKNAIYDRMNPKSPRYDASFPKPVKLGSHSIAFLESEVKAWMDERISERQAA
ncbi:AlpA family phage regulatory protein [Chitinibacter bivalviorum]|uniref:AlpA family phage regulatory protein n=1 Tax=Chitinibacter bivalviorum TaxID=2739434 RepID=A0A7H9BIZ3_9NEIS|nr:AlpA family phage regulatory protein [Chitinibacter bivalviorum]QLG88610.1 AlpA family phage regulatory protein [Chitinibacter bivalviorum]